MKPALSWLLALPALLPSCIIVHVDGDLDEEIFGDGEGATDFHELSRALEGCLVDPEYDLDLSASPWHAQAEWTVRYAAEGSDGHTAFVKAREAVMTRIGREGGVLTVERSEGTHAWSCEFEVDGDEGEASVRLVENAHAGHDRPHQIEIVWEEDD